MSATDSDDFGRCKWCGNLTDSAGCLNITCAAQSARRDSQVSGIEETVARLTKLADNLSKFGQTQHGDDLRTLLAAVDTLTRERDEAVELLDLAHQEAPRVLADALALIEARADRYRAALENIAERPSYPVDNRDAFETAISRANRALTEDA